MNRTLLILCIVFSFVRCEKVTIVTDPSPVPVPVSYLQPYTGIYNGTARHEQIVGPSDTVYNTGVKVIVALGQPDSTINLQFDYSNGVSETYSDLEMLGLKHESYLDNATKLEFEFLNDSTFKSSWVYVESQAVGKFIDIEANK